MWLHRQWNQIVKWKMFLYNYFKSFIFNKTQVIVVEEIPENKEEKSLDWTGASINLFSSVNPLKQWPLGFLIISSSWHCIHSVVSR